MILSAEFTRKQLKEKSPQCQGMHSLHRAYFPLRANSRDLMAVVLEVPVATLSRNDAWTSMLSALKTMTCESIIMRAGPEMSRQNNKILTLPLAFPVNTYFPRRSKDATMFKSDYKEHN
jgi:hypothetical protein